MEGDGLIRGCSASAGSRRPCEAWFSSVDGDRVSLELDPLVCGGSGWLKSISLAPKPIIIERACARAVRHFKLYFTRKRARN